MMLLMTLLDTIQKETDTNLRNKVKKERHELIFRIPSNIYNGAFLQKQLITKSFIVDIRPGSKYPSDERNKLFSFQIKATLKTTTLCICMWSKNCQSAKIRKFDWLPHDFI